MKELKYIRKDCSEEFSCMVALRLLSCVLYDPTNHTTVSTGQRCWYFAWHPAFSLSPLFPADSASLSPMPNDNSPIRKAEPCCLLMYDYTVGPLVQRRVAGRSIAGYRSCLGSLCIGSHRDYTEMTTHKWHCPALSRLGSNMLHPENDP